MLRIQKHSGFQKNGVVSKNQIQGKMTTQGYIRDGSCQDFNLDSSSQIQEDSDQYNRIDTQQQLDPHNTSIGHLRMETSQSGIHSVGGGQKTQNTQQYSSKGNLYSSSNLYDNSHNQQFRNRDPSIQKRQYANSQKPFNSNRNHYSMNNKEEHYLRRNNYINNYRSFSTQNSDDNQNTDKFGFIKADTLYGSGNNDGLFNSDVYINSLQTYLNERSENNKKRQQVNRSVMDRMQEHIEFTNELQKRFIEDNMNSIDAVAHERFLKYENNDQNILNKLHQHIQYTKERDHINQLTKAEIMKNSFIPCKQIDENETASQTKLAQQKKNQLNESQSKNDKNKQQEPAIDLEKSKIQESQKLNHKENKNIGSNRSHDKPPSSLKSSHPTSVRNSIQNSPRQTPKLSQTPNQSKNKNPDQTIKKQGSSFKDQISPSRKGQLKENADKNNQTEKQSSQKDVFEEKNPFLKQQTLQESQILLQEQIDQKQMLQKNRKTLKNKIDTIITKHKRVIKDIDFAYQEVTEKIKKKEILQRMRSISESQTPNIMNLMSGTQGFGGGSGKNNFQRLGRLVMNKLNSGFSQVMTATNLQSGNTQQLICSQQQTNNFLINNRISTPISIGQSPTALQSLEMQKQAIIEGIQNIKDESKIYFQARYKIREKGLIFDLSNSNNKEQVLDRVLMNYFHQQDLLNEQENLLKKATRNQKNGRSVSRGKSYKTKELGSLLTKFQPQHMRLHLKDLQKGASGDMSASTATTATIKSNQVNRHQRSMTASYGAQRNNFTENLQTQGGQQDDENVDVEIFKEKFEWKKKQNKIINFSKVCSPAEMVLQFMKQDPKYKKQQNIEAIDFLVQFDPKKAKEEEDMEGKEIDSVEYQEKLKKRYDDSIMRRIFFYLSNKNDSNTSDRFQEVTLQKFLSFFFILSGQKFDENIVTGFQTQFEAGGNTFRSKEKNEIQFFGHVLSKLKADTPRMGDQTQRNQKNNNSNNHIIILGDNHIEIETLKTIFEKITSKKEKSVLNYYEFLESIRKTSVQYYLKKISQDQIPQPQELFERFFIEFIKPKHMMFFDPEEQELIKMREHKQIDSLLKLFEDNIKDLFVYAGSMRSQTTYELSQIYLGFQEMYEILQKLDFFPNKISKTTIRYLYFYTLSLDQGLDFHDFCICLHLIGLRIIRCPLKNTPTTQTPQEIYQLQRKCREIQYTIFKLKQECALNQNLQKFIQDISLFYVHKDYIEYQRIQQKIIDIKDTNQKQIQMM